MRGATRGRRPAAWPALTAAVLAVAFAAPFQARAETAWVKDELRLNLRSGPGAKFRILRSIGTGDAVDILERREEWTKVRVDGSDEGWIPVGYLQPEMPASRQLAKWKEEAEDLRARLEALQGETEQLREANAGLATDDSERAEELERLTRENIELRAGARWPELITGASILAVGMLLGAALRRRRSGPRIRI